MSVNLALNQQIMRVTFFILFFSLFGLAEIRAQEFKKMRFNHNAFFVVDLKKSAPFYLNVLKLDSIPEPFHDGKHLWLSLGNGQTIHIIQGAEKSREYFQNNHVCLSTDNVLAFTKHLEKMNVPWVDVGGNVNKITTRVDGVQQVWLKDPDGYWVEVNNAK